MSAFRDPTATIAVGLASRGQPQKETITGETRAHQYVQSAVDSVMALKDHGERNSAIIKRLGTFAQSSGFSDVDAAAFCRELDRRTNGEWPYDESYRSYISFRNHYQRGGSKAPNSFITPMIVLTTN